MAVPTYATDLTLIDDAEAVGNYSALGGGSAGLSDETDYFIENTQSVSKAGFTAATKGLMMDTGTNTVTAGDAIFVWGKQNNRNLMDIIANGGMQVVIGNSTSAYDHFYVDGSDSEGSALAGWRNYAVDPTQTPSTTTGGGAAGTNFVGFLWKILGSGSLKGNPNAIDVQRHGRELTCIDGQAANYATFDGAAVHDSNVARAWGILTPATGGYLFHGAFVMGTVATAVDFRDEARNIVVLEDPFVPSTFNEFEIRNASSNVEWTSIQISHLGTTSPSTLTLDTGTFTGSLCRFDGCGITTFSSTQSCLLSTWVNSGQVILAEADISGSSILTSTVAADEGAVYDNRTTSGATSITELDDCTFSQGTNAHHAIRFGANVLHDITLTGIEFTGFSSVADAAGATLRFDGTTGSINVNLVGCTVDGSAATTGNVGVDDAAGITVTLVVDPVTQAINVKNEAGDNIETARVFIETAATITSGEMFQAAVTSLTSSFGTATCTTTAVHGLVTGDYVVIRDAQPDDYNKVAQVTVSSTTVFTYSVTSGISSPATATPVVSFVPLYGTTNASGNIQSSRTWGAAQQLKGWARKKNPVSPFYKDANISYTVDTSNGNSNNVVLLLDE